MNKTSINVTGEARELAVFIGNTLRDRGRNSPTYDADVYDRDANHPIGSIIVEGVVNLHQLAGIILDHLADDVVDATVLDDPADGFAPAVRTALDALTRAGVRQREHETSRYGSPASLEHAACILTEWVHADEREAKESADREALDAEAQGLWQASWWTDAIRIDWAMLNAEKREQWRKVAKAARELHGVSK